MASAGRTLFLDYFKLDSKETGVKSWSVTQLNPLITNQDATLMFLYH